MLQKAPGVVLKSFRLVSADGDIFQAGGAPTGKLTLVALVGLDQSKEWECRDGRQEGQLEGWIQGFSLASKVEGDELEEAGGSN